LLPAKRGRLCGGRWASGGRAAIPGCPLTRGFRRSPNDRREDPVKLNDTVRDACIVASLVILALALFGVINL